MTTSVHPIVIALGSNMGDRRAMLERACERMEVLAILVRRRSRLYETRPWGITDQPGFLNAAVLVKTSHPPESLLDALLKIESELGRRRLARWGPRPIDLDLLLYGGLCLDTPRLTLPHPGIAQRDFVLAPLLDLEVAPHPAVAPGGWRALLDAIPDAERTILRNEPWPIVL
ncbi:MAG: 2-amino-4-hydroxy-6-hydroxymethyldihydropteridine diphosphokinase [bacterium]|nr:2-amino-4-hydroxy-6-hydroxymethyldihydropteridine diphosphokinase [bacterium]